MNYQNKAQQLASKYDLIIFDLDHTLTKPKNNETFRKTADDWEFMPGRIEMCQALEGAGIMIAIATNQGGVAFGYFTAQDFENQLKIVANKIGASYFAACFEHPLATDAQLRLNTGMRKPRPGMLFDATASLGKNTDRTLVVGDMDTDNQAANAAEMDYMDVHEFFDEG